MYIITKYLGPTTHKGARIQFCVVDSGKREHFMEFPYHEDAPKDFTFPFKRTKYVTTLISEEKTMIYNLQKYVAYLNKKRNLQWDARDFNMTRLELTQYIFTSKFHTIELGE